MNAQAYYNENDPVAVAVLRHLVAERVIAPGDVDERSIADVRPGDLAGYTQCHFFAGAGTWSLAARLAGWPDDKPLWTGSCPCQPFSGAGKRAGADDPRHLWPDFYRLIRAGRPAHIVGEQVAGKAGYDWFDGVRADLAGEGYASRAVDVPACAVDAPHQRNRLYWVALADAELGEQDDGTLGHAARIGRGEGRSETGVQRGRSAAPGADVFGALDHPVGARLEGFGRDGRDGAERAQAHRPVAAADDGGGEGALGEPGGFGRDSWRDDDAGDDRPLSGAADRIGDGRNGSWWAGADWITCHDGKARRTEPGLCLLVDGMAGRIDLWRLVGNSIVPHLAAEVIAALLDIEGA